MRCILIVRKPTAQNNDYVDLNMHTFVHRAYAYAMDEKGKVIFQFR